jgi:hypothetical protein
MYLRKEKGKIIISYVTTRHYPHHLLSPHVPVIWVACKLVAIRYILVGYGKLLIEMLPLLGLMVVLLAVVSDTTEVTTRLRL